MTDLAIEVVYALKGQQALIKLAVAQGTTAIEAVNASGIYKQFPEIDPCQIKLGIFSQPILLDKVLKSGDRVEIYRALTIDPKAKRRLRAKASR